MQRELTAVEQKVLKLCTLLDDMLEKQENVITLKASKEEALSVAKLARIFKVEYDKQAQHWCLSFTARDFLSYVNKCCSIVKFKRQIDGSIKTHDNFTLSMEYWQ